MTKHISSLAFVTAILILLSVGIKEANAASAPIITTQPVNVTVIAPATATFKVVATGSPAPTYQWLQEAPGDSTFTAIAGATKASYVTAATVLANSGTQYECVVTNAAGSVTSNMVTLTVNVKPTISLQPTSLTVTAPATASFTVVASGTPAPSYQWQQELPGTTTFTAITGATNPSYTTGATVLANSGTKYKCVISNAAGSVTSSTVTLTVIVVPTITTQPVNATVIAPATATFKVVASATPAPTYRWMQEAPGTSIFTAITGATGASYTTPATTAANSGTQYECVVSNAAGNVTSNVVTLTVNVKPSITTQPASLTVTSPAIATFTVVASGTPAPSYQWQQEFPGTTTFAAIAGAINASYTTEATVLSNSGTKYKCVVTNAAGSVTSSTVTLTVIVVPTITTQPVNATVIAPAKATFKVVASATPAPTYQWMQEAPGAVLFTAIAGATKASYTTGETAAAQSGTQYECVVSNAAGSITSNAATLIVNPLAPSITTQPNSQTVTAPTTATFTVTASGSPAPTYQWMQEALGASSFTAIPGATASSYTTPATSTTDSGTQFECVVTNAVGSATSSAAVLTVNPAPVAPSVTTQPVNVTVTAPTAATFTVAASGLPLPTYQWLQEASGASTFTPIPGATGTSYTTPATAATDNGTQFVCAVSNSAGSVTSNPAVLTVNSLPLAPVVNITSPLNNSNLTAGSSLTITASASESNGTINSVSFYDGANLLGTSTAAPYSYTINNISVGTYTLTAKATDAINVSTISAPVTVTVTGQPAVSIVSPANNSSFTTGSINITAIASENYGSIQSVAFYNGATLLGTVSSRTQAFTYSWTNVPAGSYNITAIATDIMGSTVTSSSSNFTINAAPFSLAVDDNIQSKTDALNHTTSYQYDNLNRILKTTFDNNSTVAFAYDPFGNQTSVTDQRGNVLTKTYDAYERLSQAKDPNGGSTQFNYDSNGDLLTLTDANGHTTTYTYDGNYRVLTQSNALNLTTAFTYDAVGNVASRTDANNKTTNYTYDALNRLTNTAYPDNSSVANTFDALGRKISMADSTGQTTYTYDPLSRLLTKTSPGTNNTIIYTYNSEGNRLTSVDQNSRAITNTYDVLNRLASVTDPSGATTYGYDAVGNKIAVQTPNGVTESFTYDDLNRLLTAVNATNNGVITSFSNVYDIAGMITKKTLQDGSWTAYSYDTLNRLLEETNQTANAIVYDYVYTYDPVGNRLSWTKNTTLKGFWNVDSLIMPPQVLTNLTNAGFGAGGNQTLPMLLARSYTYDAANRLNNWSYAVNVVNSSYPVQNDTYTYDNNGNRLTKQAVLTGLELTPQQTSYTYDFENRLNQLNYVNIPGITGSQSDSLTYNGEGLRTQAVLSNITSAYLYDGSNILVERDGSGNTTKSYTRGLDLGGGIGSLINQNFTANNNAVTQYYNYNDLGSVANTTTSAGTNANSYTYDAFGNSLTTQASGDSNRYLFSSKEFDSRSGLGYFGARYYDPEVGRWLTPDPLGFVNGTNVYAYVNNNPVNLIDPFGLDEAPIMGSPGVLNPGEILNPGTNGNGSGNSDFVMPPLQNPFGSGGNNSNNPQAPTVPMSAPSNDCGGKENQKDCADVFSQDNTGTTNNNPQTTSGIPFDQLTTSTGTPDFKNEIDKNWINNAPKGEPWWKLFWWGVGQFFRVFHPHQ